MNFIKYRSNTGEQPVYMNVDKIKTFHYDKEDTVIEMIDGKFIRIHGDVTMKMQTFIMSHGGAVSSLISE